MRIALLEDEQEQAERIAELLREDDKTCDCFATGQAFLSAVAHKSYDLLILDWQIPDIDGIEVLKSVRASLDWPIPVLFVTQRDSEQDIITALDAGADDYLAKPFDPRELLLRISTILRRAQPPRPPLVRSLRLGPFTFDPTRHELKRGEETIHLTETELSLLMILAEQPGLPISRQELGERSRISGSDRAIDVQVARLRRKLEPDPRQPRYLLTRRGEGYVLRTGA